MPSFHDFLLLDLGALLTACFCAVACALVGNFLVLRRQSLMGDAVAHAVLPGLAAAFLITESRGGVPMFLGALAAGALCALAAEGLRRAARVEAGAAMGVAFSAFFAVGVILLSAPDLVGFDEEVVRLMRHMDLDADCVLNGVLETVTWPHEAVPGGAGPGTLLSGAFWAAAPRQLVTAVVACLVIAGIVGALYKELRLVSFDPGLAAALGFRPGLIGVLLVLMTAGASVASFEAVGSILVIAMLIAPPAAARMLTDRLGVQVALSALIAVATAVAGYVGAALVPTVLTARGADLGALGRGLGISGVPTVSASGGIAVAGGLALGLALVFAQRRGAVARALHRRRLSLGVAREDLLAMMYRVEEARGVGSATRLKDAAGVLAHAGHRAGRLRRAARQARAAGELTASAAGAAGDAVTLTPKGRDEARELVRTHRLWELYLVEHLGHRADHVHRTAMALEHHTDAAARAALEASAGEVGSAGAAGAGGRTDPHGRSIPPSGTGGA